MTPARRDLNQIHLPAFASLFDEKSRVLNVGIHPGFDNLYRSMFKGTYENLEILPHVKGIVPEIQADITNCPQVPDNSYDGVVCIGLYENVSNEKKMVSEIARILKPGGRALICMPGPAYYQHRLTIHPNNVFDYLTPLRLLSMGVTYFRSNVPYYVHTVSQK
jgi:SAM-dependent methyltransferase